MQYLTKKYQLPDHWYPSDPQKRAKIDEYLHWHHNNLRMGAARTFFEAVGTIPFLQLLFAMLSVNNLRSIKGFLCVIILL